MSDGKRDVQRKSLLALCGLIFLTCVIVYGYVIATGRKFIYLDVGSDTLHSFYSAYCWAVNHIKNMDFSFWSNEIGMGGSIFNYASVLLDPFAIPVLLGGVAGGVEVVADILIWVQIVKVFVCGIVCYCFLGCFQTSERGKVAAAYCYAWNGFLVLWGQHYWLGTASFWMILILYLMERVLKSRHVNGWLIIAVAWMLMQSPYIGYMCLLTAGFYTLFRVMGQREKLIWQESAKKLGAVLFSVVLGMCVSAMVFLPVAYLIVNVSGRLPSENGILKTCLDYFIGGYSLNEYKEIGLRFFSNNMYGIGSGYVSYANYYEAPQFFFSSCFLVFLAQYIWKRGRQCRREGIWKRSNIIWYLEVALLLFLIWNPAGSLIYNAFAYPFGRYTFVLMPFWTLVIALSWTDSEKRGWSRGIAVISAVALAGIYVYFARRNGVRSPLGGALVILAGTVLLCGMAMCLGERGRKSKGQGLILGAIVISVIADSFCTTNFREMADKGMLSLVREGRVADTQRALSYVHDLDEGVYRIEKSYEEISEVMDSMALGYNGISGYNSMLNEGTQRFHRELWPALVAPGGWFRQYYTAVSQAWVQSSLLGVKYLLAEEQAGYYGPDYKLLASFGDINVLQNQSVDTIAYFSSYYVSDERIGQMSEGEREWAIRKAVVLSEEDAVKAEYLKKLPEDKAAGEPVDVWKTQNSQIKLEWNGDILRGEVISDREQILVIMVPWEDGWQVWLDQERYQPIMANYAFIGIAVGEGEHVVEMRYRPPLFREGVGISLAGAFVSLAICFRQRKIENRR